jgi:adenylosuccinate lyase
MTTSTSTFCPLDDRYSESLKEIQYGGEFGFMKFRLEIEIKYFLEIVKIKKCILDSKVIEKLNELIKSDFKDAYLEIKEIEKTTKHDVKAVEYFLRNYLNHLLVDSATIEMVHYGLTSQDINTPALSLQLKHFHEVLYKNYNRLIEVLHNKSQDYKDIVMLAKTHGQPAIPTTIGNQFKIVNEAIKYHINILYNLTKDGIPTKFGGAVGHLNAHYLVDPDQDWHKIFDQHLADQYHLKRIKYTTQNLPYTYWSPIFDAYKNINCIISDFCQDVWLMISNGNFNQHIEKDQVGSSAMPQKINPIDFENAEGNADLATNMFEFLSRRLCKSRLQRDLTDSTILRNLPMPFGYSLLTVKSLIRGLNKITPNLEKLNLELELEPTIISEGLQTILRDIGCQNPYEILRKITQTNHKITINELKDRLYLELSVLGIDIKEDIKNKINNLNQFNYLGTFF